ncbi:MAG: hypothetical protein PUE12_08370 [Oscillospiraceae bacterium]|nr:hypothetical protein [Oscillospiraceae bacterium]
MENNIKRAATLIGASEYEMNKFPEDIKKSISDVVTDLDSLGDSYTSNAFNTISKLWTEGNILSALSSIASATGIPEETIKSLPDQVKKQLYYEYSMDQSDTESMYRTIQGYLSVSELNNIAAVLDIPVSNLEKLPKDIQTTICGIYSMEYGEETLATSLREVISAWL